jgi:hypothetical protein
MVKTPLVYVSPFFLRYAGCQMGKNSLAHDFILNNHWCSPRPHEKDGISKSDMEQIR